MNRQHLKTARKRLQLTQAQAASRLGVSQPYFALLEAGKRSLTPQLARRAVRVLGLTPEAVPCKPIDRPRNNNGWSSRGLVHQLSALRYPGFSYVRAGWRRNPAEVLLYALQQNELEPRVAEALPWVLLNYPEMDYSWLVRESRVRNLSNRLGFLVSLAMRAAESRAKTDTEGYRALVALESELRRSRLEVEDTFGNSAMPTAEREWLRNNRLPEADYWHVLTDWRPEHLQYV